MRVAALCAGYGGLEMGLHLSGVNVDLVWYAEIDKHASQVMQHHHAGVPNLGDLTAIEDCPQVDIVTAGFPCQPVSQAGKRKGVNDERWLIDDVVRVACRAGARYLVCENVAGILSANDGDAMARVVSALAAGGFVAEWVCVRASDVGAPHQRLRWFCIADAMRVGEFEDQDGGGRSDSSRKSGGFRDGGGNDADADDGRREQRDSGIGGLSVVGEDSPQSTADADGDGHGQGSHTRGMGRVDSEDAGDAQQRERARQEFGDRGGQAAADADSQGSQGWPAMRQRGNERPAGQDRLVDWGPYTDAIRRWEPVIGRPAPNPTDDKRRLNPRFVEWMMGLPDGWVCDAVEGRSHQLRILGNGVVPQQAALAITELLARLEDHE